MKTCSTVSSGPCRSNASNSRQAAFYAGEAGRGRAAGALLAVLLIAALMGVPSAWAANADGPKRIASPPATSAAPVISVWYGLTQTVNYDAQDDFNLLGEVDNPASTTMQVRVNGGTWRAISVGYRTDGFGDGRRLGKNGDWNADIPMTDLVDGANSVDVSATNGSGTTVVTVTVNKQLTAAPPEVVNWASVANPQDVGQYVDGKWTIGAQGLETVETGYDRLFMIGDRTWQDYEILVPITIRRLDDVGGSSGAGPGIGFIMRWQGHVVSDKDPNWQPKYAFERMGGITWLYWFDGKDNDPYEYFWGGGNNSRGGFDVRNVTLGETYWMRARVVSLPEDNGLIPAEYSWKMWQDGTQEPSAWDFVRTHKEAGMLTAGGPVLVAHHVDASFGDVVVTMLQSTNDTTPPAISNVQATNLQPDAATVSWDTDESASGRVEYGLDTAYGQQVTTGFATSQSVTLTGLTPETTYHYRVVATDAAGNSSSSADQTFTTPASTNTAPTASMTLTPQTGEAPLAVSFDGSGSSDAEGPIASYAWDFGDGATGSGATVSHTYQSAGTYTATLTVTDAVGATAQATATIDVAAPPLTAALQSDDFSGTGLDGTLWTIVDPVGDGTVTTNGTQLELSVPAGMAHDAWGTNRSLRIVQSISDVSFEVEAKFESVPTQKYQLQGLLVEEGPGNYMRFDFYSDGSSLHVFAASTTNGSSSALNDVVIPTPAESTLWMRVRREGSLWKQYYSTDGTTWTLAAEVSRSMTVAAAGVFAGNAGSSPAFTSVVDYVFDTAAPIDPEDGGSTDVTAPVISAITASPTETATTITWTTDEASLTHLDYGLDTTYGQQAGDAVLKTSHEVVLSDLTPETTYHYRVVATDAAGNSSSSADQTFTTPASTNTAPTASMTLTPQTGEAPLAVSFDGSGSIDAEGPIASYAWDFGDGATGTGATVSHTYQSAGTYTATLTVTDAAGSTGQATATIDVTAPPLTAAMQSDDFSATGLNGALWTVVDPVGDGTVTTNGTQLELSIPAGTGHDVWSSGNNSLRVTQAAQNTDFEVEVKFESVPTKKFQLQGLLVEEAPGEFLRFDFYSAGSGVRVFAADFQAGSPSIKYDQPYNATISGALWMRVRRVGDTWTQYVSADGMAWTQAAQFTRAMTVATAGPFVGNAGSNPAFTALVDYVFDTAAPIDPEDAGSTDVTAPVISAITASPTETATTITWTTDEASLTHLDYGLDTAYGQQVGDAVLKTSHEVVLSDLTPETTYHYRVVATDAAGNSSSSADQTFTTPASTNTAPTASMTLTPQTGEAPLAVSFDGSGSIDAEGPIASYAWDFGDGATGTGATVSHTYQSAGTYTATLTVTDAAGSTAQATATIDVTAPPLTAALQSDDFSGTGLDGTLWTIVDPVGDGTVTTNGTQLELSIPAGTEHDAWTKGNTTLRVLQAAQDVDFEVEAKFESVYDANLQDQGILIQESSTRFLRFDLYFDGSAINAFSAYLDGGSGRVEANTTVAGSTAHWIRVRRVGDTWTYYHSTDGQAWAEITQFTQALQVTAVGPFAGNYRGTSSPAFTAVVDYVFDTAAPIDPEDGGATTASKQLASSTIPGTGDASGDGIRDASDAGRILDHVTRGPFLDGASQARGDVSGNRQLTAYDAALLLEALQPAGTAVVRGPKAAQARDASLDVGTVRSDAGLVHVPLVIGDAGGTVRAAHVSVAVDTQAVEVRGVVSAVPDGWVARHGWKNGRLHLAAAGTSDLADGQPLATLTFAPRHGKLSRIEVTTQLNEGAPKVLSEVPLREVLGDLVLRPNFPNPVRSATTFEFSVPERGAVTLDVYNVLGQRVAVLKSGDVGAGWHRVQWEADRVASGVYFVRLRWQDRMATHKLNVVR
jgi:PKD repeat protein